MAADASRKSDLAFRTIGELATELGVPQHILRYWETRFPQLKPLQRAGNRRYYRPDDVALARRIHSLLNQEGYTIRGVQRVLEQKVATKAVQADEPAAAVAPVHPAPPAPAPTEAYAPAPIAPPPGVDPDQLRGIRARLAAALTETA